ncbi:MAG: hypothetical protein RR388_02390 [Rikenellaceae bacterium]
MKETNITFWEAAMISGLSQIQLWMLVRNNILKPAGTLAEMKIDMCKVREWIISNQSAAYEMQLMVDQRDLRFSMRNYIKKINRRRK